jgi:ornithine cyclodeaminase
MMKDWIKPGTHIACMGTDTEGKQELDPALIAAATLFTDEVAQSISIGETQHAIKASLIKQSDITPIGDVINKSHPGRTSDDEITIFDGTGVGLQDLAVASVAARLAQEQDKAIIVEL